MHNLSALQTQRNYDRHFIISPSNGNVTHVMIYFASQKITRSEVNSGQQIRSKIDSFQNANFLISQPNPMVLPLIGIVRLGETISMRVTS